MHDIICGVLTFCRVMLCMIILLVSLVLHYSVNLPEKYFFQIEEGNNVQENRLLLQSLTSYIVKQNRYELVHFKYIFFSEFIMSLFSV